jgi:hypothetical protein
LSQKSKYYELFGLKNNASKSDIKRAYRKLAMQFHPDKNPDPKANELFIKLTEAYEYLIEDKPIIEVKAEKSFEQRKKEAEFRFRHQQKKEQQEQDRYFKKLTSGWQWNLFFKLSIVSAIVSLILLIEPLLPTIYEKQTIIARTENYNGLLSDQVIGIRTDNELKIFIRNPFLTIFEKKPEIIIEKSLIFKNPVRVWTQTIHYRKFFDVDFSVVNLFPIVPILFLVPIFVLWFKRKNYWFTFGLLASKFIILPLLMYFLLTQDRWIHLITLGLV